MEQAAVEVFISYAPEDEALLMELEKHLALLVRQGVIHGWHPGRVSAGDQRSAVIAERLDRAQVIVLLVSADFHASHACYEEELTRALARQRAGKARLIPVIVRACDWRVGPLADLEALPRRRPGDEDTVPVASWERRDEAWTDVVQGLRALIEPLSEPGSSPDTLAGARHAQGDAPGQRLGADALTPPGVPRTRRPVGESPEIRELGERLEDAYRRRDKIRKAKGAKARTAEVDAEILELRRKLREGGQLRAGDVLGGRYLLLERIGRGGFAVVWRAQDREAAKGEGAEREVAIKVLHPNLAGDPLRRERFFRGARWMSELGHEAVVRVLEPHGEDEGFHYFVMEYVPGGDLKQAVLEKQLPAERVIPVILRVCEALAAAHARGMVHRDVKPANILLDEHGEPKLTDFDLVAAAETTGGTRTGALGTYLYAAPEVLERPQEADARADVYGLGMTAVFCLRGAELPQMVVRDPEKVLAALPCGEAVRGVLRKAIAWEREDRFADATAFAQALTFAARREVRKKIAESALSALEARPGVVRRSTKLLWAAVITALLGVGGAAWWKLSKAPSTPFVAESNGDPSASAPSATSPTTEMTSPVAPVSASSSPVEAGQCPAGMVFIPGGTFTMGSDTGDEDEKPPHKVDVASFCLDTTEVTVEAYMACVSRGRCTDADRGASCNAGETDRAKHPINCVEWNQAVAYCEDIGGRLPSEAEWEYAARGGSEQRLYPWGPAPPGPELLNRSGRGDGFSETAPVMSFSKGVSRWGNHDMAGNVWEWTASKYCPYPAGKDCSSELRVVRGGSWFLDVPAWVRAANRSRDAPSGRDYRVGFRCARGLNQ